MAEKPVPAIYEGEELEALASGQRYQEWIAEQFRPYLRGTVMEIGAGIGSMAQKWIAHVERLHLVEPAANLYPLLQVRFADSPHVTLHRGVLEEVVARLDGPRPNSLDAVVLVNVLEHIERDAETLRLIHRLLVPGGHLLIFVPAMPALYGAMDEKFGHYRRYTRAGLAAVCRKSGYDPTRLAYFDVLGAAPWWLLNRVLRCDRVNARMTRVFDRCAVPVGRWLEKRIAFPFGKNLVYVGRKPVAAATS